MIDIVPSLRTDGIDVFIGEIPLEGGLSLYLSNIFLSKLSRAVFPL